MSVVDNINYLIKNKSPNNIILITDFIRENELIKYMNECGIHICISEFEGFGHNSNEARSVEAVTLYTNMPCFEERFRDGINGIAIESKKNGFVNNICPRYIPTKDGIENSINKIMMMSEEELSKIGKQARQDFLTDDIEFKSRLVSLVKGNNSIPYIIHNMWISKDTPFENVNIPEKYSKNIKTLYENNKNFEFKYWSGKDILDLIKDYFPQYLDYYIQLEPNICKCDFARFIVVYIYGGLYIDLDFYCKKNLSKLLTGDSYFVYEPKEHFKNGIYLSNGFFASCKNNKFILGWIDQMKKNKNISDVLRKTGPIGLYEYYKNNKNKVLFGDTCDVISIIDTNELSKQCRGKYNNYATTLWYEGSQWGGIADPLKSVKFKKIKNPIDDTDMLWEETNNCNELDLRKKKVVFENAKNNNYNYGVLYIGSNVCDFSIPLALSLKNIGRSDITVYMIDSSQDKCDFVEKMSLINSVSNIKVLNYDLKRVCIDDLFNKGEIGHVGIYYFSGDNYIINRSKNLINICNPIIISNDL